MVWGKSAKHSPQRCGVNHSLRDEDVVQIVTKTNAQQRQSKNYQAQVQGFADKVGIWCSLVYYVVLCMYHVFSLRMSWLFHHQYHKKKFDAKKKKQGKLQRWEQAVIGSCFRHYHKIESEQYHKLLERPHLEFSKNNALPIVKNRWIYPSRVATIILFIHLDATLILISSAQALCMMYPSHKTIVKGGRTTEAPQNKEYNKSCKGTNLSEVMHESCYYYYWSDVIM